MYRIYSVFSSIIFVFVLIICGVAITQAQKLSADEIIAKHIASIGSPEAIAKSMGRMAIGKSEFVRRAPSQTATGNAVFASDGSEFAFHITFNLREYS
ncbi:MAG: hypothetical protein ACRD6X_18895, partial [Pyrinomonadaceae bacterium]